MCRQKADQLCAVDFYRNSALLSKSHKIEPGFVVYAPRHDCVAVAYSGLNVGPDVVALKCNMWEGRGSLPKDALVQPVPRASELGGEVYR